MTTVKKSASKKIKKAASLTVEQLREKQYADLVESLTLQAPVRTPSATFCNSTTTRDYAGAELTDPSTRMHADNTLEIPSRVGNQLRYRCGLITDLSGNHITE